MKGVSRMETRTISRRKPRLFSLRLSFGYGFGELLGATLTSLLNYYYVRTMGLSDGYFLIAQTVYAIYNAINDPLIGYATNRRFSFTAKLGKTTPFIIGGGLLCLISAIFVYRAPFSGQIGLLVWMALMLCLTDTFFSAFFVNFSSLVPVVVRTKKDRVGFGVSTAAVGTICMLVGFILPEFGDITKQSGYVVPMLLNAVVGAILLGVLFTVVREKPEVTQELLRGQCKDDNCGFLQILKQSMKTKNMILYLVLFVAFQTLSIMSISSLPYFLEFVMNVPLEKLNSTRTLLLLIEFAGVFVSLPAWSALAKRMEFKTIFGVCGIVLSLFCIPILFVGNLTLVMVTFFLIGLGVGGFWMLVPSVFSDTLDEIAFMTGRHDEGVYAGVRTFFARFALVLQAALYFIIRRATGFTATLAPEQMTSAMKFGIRFEMLGVAVVFMLVASVLLLAKYDLVGEKLAHIRKALDEQAGFKSEEEVK